MQNKLIFSGHETFPCRHLWLKKGYDFLKEGHNFSDPEAVVKLGVGKNMVSSIRFWLKAFDLINEREEPTQFAEYILGELGKDPYLEDMSTIWLLHYLLVSRDIASIYNLLFNVFRRERTEFNKEQVSLFLKLKCDETKFDYNEKTIQNDINVFIKNYHRPIRKIKNIEDEFSSLLIELELLQESRKINGSSTTWYKIESNEKNEIPNEIILFTILDQFENQNSISFYKLLNENNSPGMVFTMNANGLMKKINEIIKKFPYLVFTEDAGNRELQLKNNINKWEVLDQYYAN